MSASPHILGPVHFDLPDRSPHPEDLATRLGIPVNEAALMLRAAKTAELVGRVVSCVLGIEPHPEYAPQWHSMAVRSWGFAMLDLGMPDSMFIGDSLAAGRLVPKEDGIAYGIRTTG